MANTSGARFKVGDWVKSRYSRSGPMRIVELRGRLGPGGMHIYRVRVPRRARPTYNELCEDQIVLIPPEEYTVTTRKGVRRPRLHGDPPQRTDAGGKRGVKHDSSGSAAASAPPGAKQDQAMLAGKNGVPFQVGDAVAILPDAANPPRIVAVCGALGPDGKQVYRVRLPLEPKPVEVELSEDQLTPLSSKD